MLISKKKLEQLLKEHGDSRFADGFTYGRMYERAENLGAGHIFKGTKAEKEIQEIIARERF